MDDENALAAVLDGADLLVNLAGRSVSCRYTKRTADQIFASRFGTTATLGRVLAGIDAPLILTESLSTSPVVSACSDAALRGLAGDAFVRGAEQVLGWPGEDLRLGQAGQDHEP